MKNFIVLITAAHLMTACAGPRGFDRGALRASMADQQTITDADIQKALELKPQLKVPFRLGIYYSSWGYSGEWLASDKEPILTAAAELKEKKIISDYFYINESLLEVNANNQKDRQAVRLAAARGGADAVLIVSGKSDADTYYNPLAFTYILIVPDFFVPGTTVEALVINHGALWDVRNDFLYLSTETESTARRSMPMFFTETRPVIQEARSNAVSALARDITERIIKMENK